MPLPLKFMAVAEVGEATLQVAGWEAAAGEDEPGAAAMVWIEHVGLSEPEVMQPTDAQGAMPQPAQERARRPMGKFVVI